MMRLMPLAFTAFIARFPAGLFVYWVTSNSVTLAQNLAVERLMPRPAVAAPEPAPESEPASAKSPAEKSAKRKRRKRKKRR